MSESTTASHERPPASAAVRSSLGRPGGGLREVAILSYPVVIQNLTATTLHVVDSAMVGRLGSVELGAVGYGGIWIWTVFCLFLGTGTGVQTFVSQAHGAERPRECGAWVWNAMAVVLPLLSIATLMFAWLFPLFLELLQPAQALKPLATDYVRARALGGPGIAAAMVMASFFRGLGDMRIPLVGTVAANLVNAVLDYGLIFGNLGMPALGVEGAGLASSVAEWLYAGIMFFFLFRSETRSRHATAPVRPDRVSMLRFVRTGAPIGGMWFLDMVTFALFTTLIARMGHESMAASQAFVVLLHFSFMQVIGFQIAAMTLVGRYVGAGDHASAARSYRSALLLGLGFSLLIAALFLSVPDLLLRIFTGDEKVLSLAGPVLAVGAAFQIFDAVQIVASGALRGAGDTRWPFLMQTGLAWGLFLPLGYLGGVVLEGGVTGAWIGGTVYVAVLSGVLMLRFRSGAWRIIRI